MGVRFETLPGDEEIKRGEGKGEASVEHGPRARQDLLQRTDPGQPREYRLHQPPRIPCAAGTELEIGRVAFLSVAGGIPQDNQVIRKGFAQGREDGVRRIGPGTGPGHD
jgi:hypothetical protein